MGTRKRHHIVPRFLLARFASSIRGDKSFVWRVAAGARAAEISTKDAAVQSHFYGQEAEGLEAALGDAEGRWAKVLERIDLGELLQPLESELWSFLYLIAFRASPIRSAFATVAEQFIDHLSTETGGSQMRQGISRHLDRTFEELLEHGIATQPLHLRRHQGANKHLIYQHITADLADLDIAALMRELREAITSQQVIPKAVKRGHNKGIAKLLDQTLAPDAVRPVEWRLLHDPSGSVILGDSPVIAVGRTGNKTGAPWKFGKECATFYLPLSPRTILVGIRDPSTPLLSIAEVNAASSELSEAAFFCSKWGEGERMLAKSISSRWMPLSHDELQAIMQQALTGSRDLQTPERPE